MSAPAGFHRIASNVLAPIREPVTAGPALAEHLRAMAEGHPMRRARALLHADGSDRLHEMLVALCADYFYPPHRNREPKSWRAVSGRIAVTLFDDALAPETAVALDARDPRFAAMLRLQTPRWHTVIALSPVALYQETALGPHRGAGFATAARSDGGALEAAARACAKAAERATEALSTSAY